MKYRKKPVIVEAIQWTGENYEEVKAFLGGSFECWHINSGIISIKTLDSIAHASKDDWIIKGTDGEYYPCKPHIFEAIYEPIEEKAENNILCCLCQCSSKPFEENEINFCLKKKKMVYGGNCHPECFEERDMG